MVKIIIGMDVYGLIKKHSVKIVLIKIIDLILKIEMVNSIGFMDLLPM